MIDINQQFQNASDFLKNGQLKEAVVALKTIINQEPEFVQALNMYGITLAQLGKFPLAAEQFSKILKVQPENTAAFENLARSNMRMHEFHKAKMIYEQLIKLGVKSYNTYFGLAGALMSLNSYEESLIMFRKAESLNVSESQLYVNLGTVYSQLGQTEDAINNFNKAINLQPESVQANLRLGQLLLKNNKTVKAETLLFKADQLQSDNFEITLSLADAYLQNSKKKQALKFYFKADELAQKSQNVYTKLDKLLFHNDVPEKKVLIDKLIEEQVYQSWSEARDFAKELLELTDYFDKSATEALQLFFSHYNPGKLYSRDWWQKQLDSFGDARFGHDKILRGIHSAVYSWSLPDGQTLALIAEFIIDDRLYSYGAGSALWERLLSDYFSINVVASDFEPRHSFLPIETKDYSTTIISGNDVIFLSWVIRGDQGVFNLLNQMMKGQKLVLVGEPPDEQGVPRICATPEMFSLLDKEFMLVQSIPLVSYSMLNDTACLYIKN